MSGKQSVKVTKAINRVIAGETRYAAAKAEGVWLSTVYLAWKRYLEKQAAKPTVSTIN